MAARVLVVLALLGVTGLVGFALASPPGKSAQPPAVERLLAGTGWSITKTYERVPLRLDYQQWLLADPAGNQAQLYVGTTSRAQTIFGWWGDFGYLGEGFVVDSSTVQTLRAGSTTGRMTLARIRHGADVKQVASTAIRPDGIVASGSDHPVGLAWDSLAHRGAPYYAIRVTVDGTGAASADRAAGLLTMVVSSLVHGS